MDGLSSKLKHVELRQSENDKELRQFEHRALLEEDVAVMRLVVEHAVYDGAYEAVGAAKVKRKEALARVLKAQEDNKPLNMSRKYV